MFYDYKEDFQILAKKGMDGISSDVIKERYESGEYGEFEVEIIRSVYKYQFLNIFNINRYMCHILTKGKDDYSINVQKLMDDGVLIAYEGNGMRLYSLSRGAFEYMIERRKKTYSFDTQLNMKAADILEKMSVNQYHISFISNNKVSVEKSHYLKEVRGDSSVIIPSYIKYKGKTYIGMSLYKDNVSNFLNKFIKILTALDNEERVVIVLTASSSKEALDALNVLQTINKFPYVCYVLDIETYEYNPVECLKRVTFNEGVAQISKLV